MFELGLSGQMFDDGSVWDHLEAAAGCGYHCVELRSTHVRPELPKRELQAVRDGIAERGLYTSCLSCFTGNYGLRTESECREAFEQFKRYVELAGFMDCEMIRIWPAWQDSASAPREVWDRATAWMRASAEYAAGYGRRLVMEMHHGTLCDTAGSSVRLLEAIDAPNVGVTLDPVNLYQVPADYGEKAIERLGAHLFNVHIKDIVQLAGGDCPYSFAYSYYAKHIGRFTPVIPPRESGEERWYCHRRINAGGIDWCHVLKSLDAHGYAGPLVVESVAETNRLMPGGRDLAEACYQDVQALFALLDG